MEGKCEAVGVSNLKNVGYDYARKRKLIVGWKKQSIQIHLILTLSTLQYYAER